jgi:hypothetical protein
VLALQQLLAEVAAAMAAATGRPAAAA